MHFIIKRLYSIVALKRYFIPYFLLQMTTQQKELVLQFAKWYGLDTSESNILVLFWELEKLKTELFSN